MASMVTQAKKEVNKLTKPVMKLYSTGEKVKAGIVGAVVGGILTALLMSAR